MDQAETALEDSAKTLIGTSMWEYIDRKTEEGYQRYFKEGQLAQWGSRGVHDFPEMEMPNR